MINRIAGRDYFVACISTGRPYAIERWAKQGVGRLTWFVPREEWAAYRHAPRKRPGSSLSNAIARNQALKCAHRLNLPLLLLDDDPIAAFMVQNQRAYPIAWEELFTQLAEVHAEHGTKLTAANRNTNPIFVQRDLNFHPKLTTGVCIIEPEAPLFDENLKLAVDLDYGMQHLALYGAWLRVDYLIAAMEMGLRGHGSAMHDQRTEEEYRRTNVYLKSKWGDALVKSRNKNQLTMKPRRREVLR